MKDIRMQPPLDAPAARPAARPAAAPARPLRHGLGTWALFAWLYTCQYIGISFFGVALVAVLREGGASLATLSLVSLSMGPVALRFLWAPLVDRYGRTPRGHYRNWLMPAQLGMALCLLAAAAMDPLASFPLLLGLLLVFAVMTATQDIALDGMACALFHGGDRVRINTVQVAAGMLGNVIGGGLVVMFYPQLGWAGSLLVLAAMLLLCCLQLLFFSEGAAGQTAPAPLADMLRLLAGFWQGNRRWLCMLALYTISFGAFNLLTPLLVDRGWTLPQIGGVTKVFAPVAGLLAAAVSGPLLRRVARRPALLALCGLQVAGLLMVLGIALWPVGKLWVYVTYGIYFGNFSPVYIMLTSIMMDKAADSPMPSTLYTLQNASTLFFGYVASSGCLWLADRLGYQGVVLLCVGCVVAAAALAYSLFGNTGAEKGSASG